jgi:hypothetical protein
MTNDEYRWKVSTFVDFSTPVFVIRHSRCSTIHNLTTVFVIRDSSFAPRGRGSYSKSASDSIHSKEAVLSPVRPDPELDPPSASRAMAHVMRTLPIDVNPCVH